MTDDIDDIFKTFDKIFERMMHESGFRNMGVFPWSNANKYSQHRNTIRSSNPPREEIFRYDNNVTIVMDLGYGYTGDNVAVDLIEDGSRRLLQLKSGDGRLTRRYALTDDMTGEFDWRIQNGMIEIVLAKKLEVVELGEEDNSGNKSNE